MPFQKGNTLGRGRPRREVEEDYRLLFRNAVTKKDYKEIIKRAVVQAKNGNATARAWISNYLIGTPTNDRQDEVMEAFAGILWDRNDEESLPSR